MKKGFFFFFGIERTTRLGQKRSGLFANGMLLLSLEYSCLHRVEQSKYYPSTGKTRLNGSSSSSWLSLFEPIIRIFQAFLHLSPIFPFHFYSFAVQDQLEGNRRRHRFTDESCLKRKTVNRSIATPPKGSSRFYRRSFPHRFLPPPHKQPGSSATSQCLRVTRKPARLTV